MIFYSLELFRETTKYYTDLFFLPDAKICFLCTDKLIAEKIFITVWE